MIIANYKDCTIGVTARDADNDVTIFGFNNNDGEYFVKQVVYSESIDENSIIQELCEYIDDLKSDYTYVLPTIIERKKEKQIEEDYENEI